MKIVGTCLEKDKLTKMLHYGYSFPQLRLCIIFCNKWTGLHSGRFFSQTHLVTLIACIHIVLNYIFTEDSYINF
jgi:hypothetical protein